MGENGELSMFSDGEKEALITNLDEGEMEDVAFPELYYKRLPIERNTTSLDRSWNWRIPADGFLTISDRIFTR
jgi:hypothetical protein